MVLCARSVVVSMCELQPGEVLVPLNAKEAMLLNRALCRNHIDDVMQRIEEKETGLITKLNKKLLAAEAEALGKQSDGV